ncbi:MAG: type II secretion system F family protein [Actinomycetia bacterium]|nr:type II secretion system F family protein [Actinomycetes bacterium]
MSDLILFGATVAAAGFTAYLVARLLIEWGDGLWRFRQVERAITGAATSMPELLGSLPLSAAILAVAKRLRRPGEIARMRAALPDLLDQLAQTLRAGLSLHQAIMRLEEQPDATLAELLHALNVDLSLGYSVSESLERFQAKVLLPELRMVALALELQHRTGGNIAELLERSAGLQRQSLQMLRSLRAQTAQGRMSVRLVVAIPLSLVAVMALVMPDYLGSFLSSNLGLALALLACVLLGIGFAGVRRVVNIEL